MSQHEPLRVELDSLASKDGVADLLESTAQTMRNAKGKRFRVVLIIRERESKSVRQNMTASDDILRGVDTSK